MGRLIAKAFLNFHQPFSSEEKLLLQIEVATNLMYLLFLTVMLFFALRKCRCRRKSRGGGRVQTNGGDTASGQIATEVHHNVTGQISGEVSIDVAAGDDDDGDTNNGEIAMGPTSVAATMAFLLGGNGIA